MVLVWIVSVSSIATAQRAATPAETTFVLDWPAGAEATVVASRVIQNPFRGSTISSEARFSMTVTRAAGTTTLTSRDLSLAPIRERMAEDALHAALVATMYLPSATLTRTGGVGALVDPGGSRRAIESAVASALPEETRAGPLWEMVSGAWSSDRALEASARSTIEMMLASLASRSLVPGRSVEATGASELIVSGVRVSQRGTLQMVRTLPCFDGDAPDRCAEVTMRTVPDPAALARIAEAAGLGSLEMSMDAVLVTEPRTLLPHRCEVRTRRRYAIPVGGATRQIEELEIRTWRFTYRAR
ncbi:Hypothetical protein I5071_43070 [Sandaracinus amylolyticus]|nr:Hypothetical protein I5071_43070 [Sandaracinus amylolyticus]